MYISCGECGRMRFFPAAYLPTGNEPEPFICEKCGKRWELVGDRRGVKVREAPPEQRADK